VPKSSRNNHTQTLHLPHDVCRFSIFYDRAFCDFQLGCGHQASLLQNLVDLLNRIGLQKLFAGEIHADYQGRFW